MKKLLIIFLLTIATNFIVKSQQWTWSEQLICAGDVTPIDVITDNSGNSYLAGTYTNGALTIGNQSIPASGGTDAFIAKFDNTGTLLWLNSIAGTANDEVVSLVIVGSTLYVAGNHRSNPVFFTPGFSLPNQNNWDAFLASYDTDGNFITAVRIFQGQSVERIKDMIYNPLIDELCYVTQFKTEITYTDGTGPVTKTARSDKDLFISKSDFAGVITDTASYSTSVQNSILKDINRSNDNGYYLSGDLFGTIYFNATDSITGNSEVNSDMVIVKINQNLDFLWARKGGGPGYDHANNGISDIFGNVYVTGKLEADVEFDSTATLKSNIISGYGAQDLYLAKYNKLGTLQWVKRKGDAGNDNGYGLIQRENLVQFCGNVSGEVIFNEDTLQTSGTADMNTGFAVFDRQGNEIGAQGIGGNGEDVGSAINFDSFGNTIISGSSISDTNFIGDSSYINTTGTYNGFIASYYYPMKAVFTSTQTIKCNGNNTGRLIVTPFFGVGPYTYNWSPNVTSSNDSLATNLPAGTYSVTITDSRSETAENTIILNEPSAIVIDSTISDVNCHPTNGIGNNGSIDITVSGGTAASGYSYNWTALSGSGVNSSAEDQNTLTKGIYRVLVSDDNGCTLTDTFTIDQPQRILFTGSVVTNAAGGASDGEIDLSVTGGNDVAPYPSYSWTNEDLSYSAATEDISGLPGDNYYVTVTDSKSCAEDTVFVVEDATLFIATVSSKTDVDCYGDNTGSATVTTTGRTGPYTYSWSNGGNGPTINNLEQNTYYVTVTDNPTGDFATTSVQINQPATALSASISGSDLTCYNNGSGSADLTITGGTIPYAFSWSNGSGTEDIADLDAGDYFVTVTDDNGCTTTANTSIDEPVAMDVSVLTVEAILCNGDNTGILEAVVTGGTGTKSYIWDDQGNQTTRVATDLIAGIYNVTATDINGCSVMDNGQLFEPSEIVITPSSVQDISCFGEEDGIIALTVAGGTSPLSFLWSNGQISQNIQSLEAGDYRVTVTDANNCNDTLTVTLTQPDQIIYQSIVVADASCAGYDDGSITLEGTGGTGSLQYSIDGGANYITAGTFADLSAQNYTLQINDASDCQSADSVVTVSEPAGISITEENATDITCNGNSDGTITISASSAVGGLQYSIDGGANFADNGGSFSGLSTGNYEVQIMDLNSCIQTGSMLSILEPSLLTLDTTVNNAIGDAGGTLLVEASGGTSPYTYVLFSVGDTSSNDNGSFTDLLPGSYSTLVNDLNDCTSEIVPFIIEQISTELTIYDAFSPNGDGYNETWEIDGIDRYPNCTVSIFNSWGNQVFSADGYPEPWDGTYNGKELPSGTYLYVIDPGDGSDALTGTVNIIR